VTDAEKILESLAVQLMDGMVDFDLQRGCRARASKGFATVAGGGGVEVESGTLRIEMVLVERSVEKSPQQKCVRASPWPGRPKRLSPHESLLEGNRGYGGKAAESAESVLGR